MRSVLLDTVSDSLASATVMAAGVVIYITHRFFWLDSVLSVAIAAVFAVGALRLRRDVALALKSEQPRDLDDDDWVGTAR